MSKFGRKIFPQIFFFTVKSFSQNKNEKSELKQKKVEVLLSLSCSPTNLCVMKTEKALAATAIKLHLNSGAKNKRGIALDI
jgi:hypothetical protein